MSLQILATKLYTPAPRATVVSRPRLIARLNEGLLAGRKLTLISAPAGFGKTTLISEWAASCEQYEPQVRVAWLSLDKDDNDVNRFLTYFVAALQTIAARQDTVDNFGEGVLHILQSPEPPPTEAILTTLLNEITTVPDNFILVLDDYHVIESPPVDAALTFLLDHLPEPPLGGMHLVIASREDPQIPVARLRARGQLTELRAADLRFTSAEAAEFLNQAMGLNLSSEDVAALEARTEGWIAGLQLAALAMQGPLALQGSLSMRGHANVTDFIQAFTGSHRFVLDYLVEEVLRQQPENIQTFLLRTSILDRLCGPLCDAVLGNPAVSGQETLEYLERTNLFIVPLDNERRWYRYHHLFSSFLRQRLEQNPPPISVPQNGGDERGGIAALHIRASEWYEHNGLVFEAFRQATEAGDVARAERLTESPAIGLYFRNVATAIIDWLVSLPQEVLDARPQLWVRSATLALVAGQTTGVEERLRAAENALQNIELDDKTRDLIGKIACARATLALTRYDPETMLIQARRALDYLHPDDLVFLFTANWALASAYLFQGNRAASAQALMESLAISQKSGDMFSMILAIGDLGLLQELDNQLYQAAEAYQKVLQLAGEYPQPNIAEVQLGLARIHYEWNDLDTAEQYGQQSLQLARQYDQVIDRFIISEVFLARMKLAQGDVDGAAAQLAQTEQSARQRNFVHRMPEIAAAQVDVLLRQGNVTAAAHLVRKYELPLSQARILMAQGDAAAALALLASLRQQMEAKGWQDERLKVMVLQAVALQAHGEQAQALQVLEEALVLAEPGGIIRLFVDEGLPMAELLSEATARGVAPDYVTRLLAAFPNVGAAMPQSKIQNLESEIIEPLSQRELEVLQLIAQGLSNREIAERLFLALSTVKGHNREIFGKLQVQRRTEAIARARELGLL